MALFSKKCDRCGHENSSQASFCNACGTKLGGSEIKCGVCGTNNRSDARFCRDCGRPLDNNVAPELRNNRWARQPDDFATHVEASDLKGLLKRGLIVDVGTNAMLVDGGANKGMLGPGTHNLDSLEKRLNDWLDTGTGSQVWALLVDVTPTDLEFAAGGIFTKDPLRIGVRVRLQTQVDDPARFLINRMGGREHLSKTDLQGYLYPEVNQVLEAWVAGHTVKELAEDLTLRPQLELALEEALKPTFHQTGLKFISVRATELNLEHIDHIKGLQSKYALQLSEAEAELQGRKSIFKVMHEDKLQQWAEETAKVEEEEKRVALYDRMQHALLAQKTNEIENEQAFEAFLDKIDYEKLLREKQRADLLQAWKQETEDKELARRFLIEKLRIEQEYETRKIALIASTELTNLQVDSEIALARKRADFEFEQQRKLLEQELSLQREKDRIAQERQKAEDERVRLLAQQQLADDVSAAQAGIKLLEEMKRIKRLDEEERLRIQREDEFARRKLVIEEEIKRFEMAERQRQAERDYELNRLEKLGHLGTEALIAASPVDQARMLADLKKDEALKNLSADQILALAAKDSPDVARAIGARYEAVADGKATEQERQLYQKLLDAQKEEIQRINDTWNKVAEREQEISKHAIDRMTEVAQAFAKNQANPTPVIVNTPGTNGPLMVNGINPTIHPTNSKNCPNCGRFVLAEARHCEYCGHKFEGVN